MDYHVRWEKHERNISDAFNSLRNDEHFCDVVLACEGRQFQAHKVVLSAGSSFFEPVLKTHKHPCPLIYLKGVKANHMELLLDFMYSGEAAVKQDVLENFLKTGDELGVRGLTCTSSSAANTPRGNTNGQTELGKKNKIASQQMGNPGTFSPITKVGFKGEIPAPKQTAKSVAEENQVGKGGLLLGQQVKQMPVVHGVKVLERGQGTTVPDNVPLLPKSFNAAEDSMVVENSRKEKNSEDLGDSLGVLALQQSPSGEEENGSGRSDEAQSHQIEEWNDLKKYVTVAQGRVGRGGHHVSGVKVVYQCSLCDKLTPGNLHGMMAHIESVHFRGAIKHTCAICQKTFDTRSILYQHKFKVHKSSTA